MDVNQVASFASFISEDSVRSRIDLPATSCGKKDLGCFIDGNNVTDESIHQIVFFATAASLYSITVEIDGIIMARSPFFFSVLPDELSVKSSNMEGGGCKGGIVGYLATFDIFARDFYGNKLSVGGATWIVTIEYEDGTESDIVPEDINSGIYPVKYFISKVSAKAILSVKSPIDSSFVHLSNSPIFVNFIMDDYYTIPTVSILSGFISRIRAGSDATFTVSARNFLGHDRCTGNETVSAILKLLSSASSTDLRRNISSTVFLNISDLQNGKYRGSLSITLAGTYQLVVTLNGNHIRGSPWAIRVVPGKSSSRRSKIKPSTASDLGSIAGRFRRFLVQSIDSYGNSQVYDEFYGPDLVIATMTGASTIYCSVFDNKDSTYSISYTATAAGMYQLSIQLYPASDARLSNFSALTIDSPLSSSNLVRTFSVRVLAGDVNPKSFSVIRDGLEFIQAGATATIAVIPRDQFGNIVDSSGLKISSTLLVSPNGPDSTPIPFKVDSSAEKFTYVLDVAVTKSGYYVVAVMLDSDEISESPLDFTVSSGPVETRNCSLDSNTFKNVFYTGKENRFLLRTYDRYVNAYTVGQKAFSAMLSGPQNARGLVTDNFDGTYNILLPAVQTLGVYRLSVERQQVHIRGSPFSVEAKPGDFDSLKTTVSFSGDPVVAGTRRTLYIYARDSAGNQLTLGGEKFSLVTRDVLQIGEIVTDNQNGVYNAGVSTTIAGQYLLQVTWSGYLLNGGSILVSVVAAEAIASQSIAFGSGLDDTQLVAGYSASINAKAIDVYGNVDLSWSNVFNINITNHLGLISWNSSHDASFIRDFGVYALIYVLTKSGSYSVQVSLKSVSGVGDGTVAQARKIIIAADTQSFASKVFPPEKNCTPSSTVSCALKLIARDQFFNDVEEDGDIFIAKLLRREEGQDSAITVGKVTGTGGPNYNVQFKVTASGTYRLLVSRYFTSISGSNIILTVLPGPVSPQHCTTSGSGLNGAVPDVKSVFSVIVRDEFGNRIGSNALSLNLNINPAAVSEVAYVGLGEYTVSWTPFTSGKHIISLMTYSALHVAHSPFQVVAINKTFLRRGLGTEISASFCTTTGMLSYIVAGQHSSFSVQPRNIKQQLVVDVNLLSNSKFVVQIDGHRCQDCPMNDTLASVVCCIDQASIINSYVITVEYTLRLAGRRQIDIYQNLFDNNVESHPILNSPFSILVIPGELDLKKSGFPLMVLSSGKRVALGSVRAGTEISILFQMRDSFENAVGEAGFDNIGAFVQGLFPTVIQMTNNHDGTATLIFAQKNAYPSYALVAEYKKIPLNGFPLVFAVVPGVVSATDCVAFTYDVSNDNILKSAQLFVAGQSVNLFVSGSDQYGNKINSTDESFQAIVSGPKRIYLPTNLGSSGFYTANLTDVVKLAGTYTIDIVYASVEIKNSPLTMVVVPDRVLPSACYASGIGSIFSTATVLTRFTLVARDRFNNVVTNVGNKFNIVLISHALEDNAFPAYFKADQRCSGQFHCHNESLTVTVKGTYDAASSIGQYVAMMPAVYVLSIAYDGSPIHRSDSASCCNASECTSCVNIALAAAPAPIRAVFSNSGTLTSSVTWRRIYCTLLRVYIFVSAGGMIFVTFDSITDKSGLTGRFNCSLLIEAKSLALLSGAAEDPQCTFVNPTVLSISLCSGASVRVNDKITLSSVTGRGLRQQTACLNNARIIGLEKRICFITSQVTSSSVRVDRPVDPVSPVAILKGPSLLGVCDDLVLDASSSYGSAGRQLQFYFGLLPGSANDDSVRALILRASRPPYHANKITIPAKALLDETNYTFLVCTLCRLDAYIFVLWDV